MIDSAAFFHMLCSWPVQLNQLFKRAEERVKHMEKENKILEIKQNYDHEEGKELFENIVNEVNDISLIDDCIERQSKFFKMLIINSRNPNNRKKINDYQLELVLKEIKNITKIISFRDYEIKLIYKNNKKYISATDVSLHDDPIFIPIDGDSLTGVIYDIQRYFFEKI